MVCRVDKKGNLSRLEIFHLPVTRAFGVVVNTPSSALCNEESCGSIPSTSDSFYENSNSFLGHTGEVCGLKKHKEDNEHMKATAKVAEIQNSIVRPEEEPNLVAELPQHHSQGS
jgi:hypothetical protein